MRLPSSLFATTEALRQGWGTARAHPLRSALGGLAVAVAVGTVVSVDASLFALREYARRSTARTFGADTFVLAQVASAGQVSRRELARKLERNPPCAGPSCASWSRTPLAGRSTPPRSRRAPT